MLRPALSAVARASPANRSGPMRRRFNTMLERSAAAAHLTGVRVSFMEKKTGTVTLIAP